MMWAFYKGTERSHGLIKLGRLRARIGGVRSRRVSIRCVRTECVRAKCVSARRLGSRSSNRRERLVLFVRVFDGV
jgi:hypothetical protein